MCLEHFILLSNVALTLSATGIIRKIIFDCKKIKEIREEIKQLEGK